MDYAIVTDSLLANWDSDTFTPGTTWRDSVSNKAINFTSSCSKSIDGIELSQSVTFSSESLSSFSLTFPFTIQWIGRIDSQSFNNTYPGNILGMGEDNNAWDNSLCLYSKLSPSGIQLDADSSGTITSGIYTTNIEYNIVVTVSERSSYFEEDTITLYINSASSVGSASYTRWDGNGNPAISASKNYIYNGEGNGRFDGAIQSIRIWNKCLSSSEIQTIYTKLQDKRVYIKQGNSWKVASKYYKKQNGVWVEQSDPSVLTDANTKYVLYSK